MRVLALALLALAPCVDAMRMAINCSTTADCNDGETCVAGDSALSIQACVAGAGCGGATSGNCPSDAQSGDLACIWRPSDGCSGSATGCAELGGSYGIYKCLSIDRCDEYYGGSACSDGCNVNGAQCNGQGSCGVSGTSADGTPTFSCTCNSGYSGDKCESGSSAESATSSKSNSEATDSSSKSLGSSSTSGSTASTSRSTSGSTSSSVSSSGSTSSSSSSSSVNSSRSSSGSVSPASAEGAGDNTAANPSAASGSVSSESSSGGTSSAVFIIIGVLAACIIIGALMFAMYSRKKKREQEAEAGGFGGPAAFGATARFDNESAIAGGTGADTPKSSIVTM
ncbi:hypothetical protein PHYBOEH_009352 [Phytophthora boehmeriae]|uniref:EGF-like domain-containing protein n=1 Tax=Phytophthora boehmeriae TaxID=109152 RepID=A0A8T1VTU5_9STRA|nr:hypothetical protein PHYBOEH_009352 [Phytophthora boehmeriae]